MPEKACEVLCEELGAGRHALRSFLRETPAALGKAERIPAIQLAA
jgi:S-adenosylmethionine decarboxylase